MSPTGPGVASARHDRSCRPARPTVAVRAGLDTGCDDGHARAQRGAAPARGGAARARAGLHRRRSSWCSRSDRPPTAPTGSPPRWRPRTRGSVPSPNPTGRDPERLELAARRRAPRDRGARRRPRAAPDRLRAGRGRDARRDRRRQRRRRHGRRGLDAVRAGGRPRDDRPGSASAARVPHRAAPTGRRRHRLPRRVPARRAGAGRRLRRVTSCGPRTGR